MQERTNLELVPSPGLEFRTHRKRYGCSPLDGRKICWFAWLDLVCGCWASRKQSSGTYMGVQLAGGHMDIREWRCCCGRRPGACGICVRSVTNRCDRPRLANQVRAVSVWRDNASRVCGWGRASLISHCLPWTPCHSQEEQESLLQCSSSSIYGGTLCCRNGRNA